MAAVRLALITLCLGGAFLLPGAEGASRAIRVVGLKGSVNPGSAHYFLRVLDEANRSGDELLLVELDTPGGLVSSLRTMVQGVMASRTPVVVYVAPSGAQAASAGALLLLSAHVAAMAPGTETGAAHPVAVGGSEEKGSAMEVKTVNDLAAFARSLAEKRGRNPVWAEQAVRESIASSATEALDAGVIDTVAARRGDLLRYLDGRKVSTWSGVVTIHTAGAPVIVSRPAFGEQVMMAIADPNIAAFLLLLGIAGLYFELSTPGAVLPGVAGAISLLLGAYAMQLLSVNTTGILLIALALLFFVLEIFVVSSGVLAIAGLVSLFIGSIMVFNAPELGLVLNWWFFLPLFLSFSAGVLLFIIVVARSTRSRRLSGIDGLVGETGIVMKAIEGEKAGKVFVHGELWSATAPETIIPGEKVTVTGVEGLRLRVGKTL